MVNCIGECVDMASWRQGVMTGEQQSDFDMDDSIEHLVYLGKRLYEEAAHGLQASQAALDQRRVIEKGYIEILFDECGRRSLDGLWVLSAILMAAGQYECPSCPFNAAAQLSANQI